MYLVTAVWSKKRKETVDVKPFSTLGPRGYQKISKTYPEEVETRRRCRFIFQRLFMARLTTGRNPPISLLVDRD